LVLPGLLARAGPHQGTGRLASSASI